VELIQVHHREDGTLLGALLAAYEYGGWFRSECQACQVIYIAVDHRVGALGFIAEVSERDWLSADGGRLGARRATFHQQRESVRGKAKPCSPASHQATATLVIAA
jgi:hypothetical protein